MNMVPVIVAPAAIMAIKYEFFKRIYLI